MVKEKEHSLNELSPVLRECCTLEDDCSEIGVRCAKDEGRHTQDFRGDAVWFSNELSSLKVKSFARWQ